MFNSETISREFIGSDFFQTQHPSQTTQHQNSGLARYRSAPGSFFTTLLDSDSNNNNRNDEDSEYMFSAFINGTPDLNQKSNFNSEMQFAMKQEDSVEPGTRPGLMGYQSAVNIGGGAVIGSYSVDIESTQLHSGGKNGNSNLLRQSSSPAGFLNGFNITGDMGNYKVQDHSEAGSPATGLSNHINFSSSQSSSIRFMPSIPESGNEPIDSWNESPFNSFKRNRDGDTKMFSAFNVLDSQNGETRKSSSGLVHHLSLPNTSIEMAAVEKFLHFQPETAPCQIRAKRGCATHPRSIAERVRRTKISEKMKKLQDLFPDMDKQVNTSDMLELAVGYIKDLQKKVQTLTDTRAKCMCSSKPQQWSLTT